MSSQVDGFNALFADINKVKESQKENTEGIVSAPLAELDLEMDDSQIIELVKKWETSWKPYEAKIKKRQDDNEKYWMGQAKKLDDIADNLERPTPDNLIFESLETLIPIATRQNPEPVVEADNTTEGNALADKVGKMLWFLARHNNLKLSVKKLVRDWALYFLGAGKVGWSTRNNEVTLSVIRPQRLILDPDATIFNGEYTGDYIGEVRKDKASDLVKRFPKKKAFIEELVQGKMGTELNYTEWWTDDFVVWTLKKEVLHSIKNPHWNYEQEKDQTDEMGNVTKVKAPGRNHFAHPKKPYIFLSVFNLGIHPHDDTNLIHQNLGNQDLISKRVKQIDRNADATNGGSVVSGDHFTKEQAARVGEALRNGDTLWVPTGNVNDAYKRDIAPPLPGFISESLNDYRNVLRQSFGISGSTPGGTRQERTVKGKTIQRAQDTDRIGGGISEFIEKWSEHVFNWWVQLMYVYYDEQHVATVVGQQKAKEYVQLSMADLTRKLTVTVKEGSLLPKDTLTQRDEAIELWGAGAIDPITLFEKLDWPNPREAAKQLVMWKSNPLALFPELQQPQAPPGPEQPQPTQPIQ